MTMRITPTETLDNVYAFVVQYKEEHGYPPTYREIAEGCDISGPSHARWVVRQIEQTQGKLKVISHIARGIQICD